MIASLHAMLTLERLAHLNTGETDNEESGPTDDYTSLLFTLKRVPQVFEEAFRSFRFRVPRVPGCLVCSTGADLAVGENLNVAVDEALARLGPK